jgi:hypothetical protein
MTVLDLRFADIPECAPLAGRLDAEIGQWIGRVTKTICAKQSLFHHFNDCVRGDWLVEEEVDTVSTGLILDLVLTNHGTNLQRAVASISQ